MVMVMTLRTDPSGVVGRSVDFGVLPKEDFPDGGVRPAV
jgi:hypothetical protein